MSATDLSIDERAMSSQQDLTWSFTVLARGQAQYIRNRVVPFAESLTADFHENERIPTRHTQPDSPLRIEKTARPQASFLSASMIGILLFFGNYISEKLLDEVLKKIRPHVRKLLSENSTQLRRRETVLVSVWYERLQKGAFVAICGNSTDGLLTSETNLESVHLEAERVLQSNRSEKPIALFIIHNGFVREPVFFDSAPDVYQYLANLDVDAIERGIAPNGRTQ
jgi:hypothetical protein